MKNYLKSKHKNSKSLTFHHTEVKAFHISKGQERIWTNYHAFLMIIMTPVWPAEKAGM
jgi:hypothetical protein